jgi:hypothetical protein
MKLFQLYGLRIASDVPLPASSVEQSELEEDYTFTVERVAAIAATPAPGRCLGHREGATWGFAFTEDQGVHTLRFYETAEFVLRGKRIVARLPPHTQVGFAVTLFVGTVLATVLELRGGATLHASALVMHAKGVAIAGPSGAGKSTLAALLALAGGRVRADDTLRVRLGEQVLCDPGPCDIRLRPNADALAGRFAPSRVSQTVDERRAVSMEHDPRPFELGVVIRPDLARDLEQDEWLRLSGGEALGELLACYRVGMWTEPHIRRSKFRFLAELARRVPVVRWRVPFGETGVKLQPEQLNVRLLQHLRVL